MKHTQKTLSLSLSFFSLFLPPSLYLSLLNTYTEKQILQHTLSFSLKHIYKQAHKTLKYVHPPTPTNTHHLSFFLSLFNTQPHKHTNTLFQTPTSTHSHTCAFFANNTSDNSLILTAN